MLKIVQGDVFELHIDIRNVPLFLIKRVVFSSKDLGVEIPASFYDGRYDVRIEGEWTSKFEPGFVRYDITMFLTDGEKLTIVQNEKIEVLKKVNEVKNGAL